MLSVVGEWFVRLQIYTDGQVLLGIQGMQLVLSVLLYLDDPGKICQVSDDND